MTGFARAEGSLDGFAWAWELKSVNSKSLDLRLRLPPGFDHLEPQLRSSLAARLKRGNVSANLSVQRGAAAGAGIRINRAALDQILALVEELAGQTAAAAPRLDGLLALRGVLETAEDEVETPEQREERSAAILASWGVALQQL